MKAKATRARKLWATGGYFNVHIHRRKPRRHWSDGYEVICRSAFFRLTGIRMKEGQTKAFTVQEVV